MFVPVFNLDFSTVKQIDQQTSQQIDKLTGKPNFKNSEPLIYDLTRIHEFN